MFFVINLVTFEVLGPFFGFRTALKQKEKNGDEYVVVKTIIDREGNLVG